MAVMSWHKCLNLGLKIKGVVYLYCCFIAEIIINNNEFIIKQTNYHSFFPELNQCKTQQSEPKSSMSPRREETRRRACSVLIYSPYMYNLLLLGWNTLIVRRAVLSRSSGRGSSYFGCSYADVGCVSGVFRIDASWHRPLTCVLPLRHLHRSPAALGHDRCPDWFDTCLQYMPNLVRPSVRLVWPNQSLDPNTDFQSRPLLPRWLSKGLETAASK